MADRPTHTFKDSLSVVHPLTYIDGVETSSAEIGKRPRKEYVYFINGVRAPAGEPEKLMAHRQDLTMLECTEKAAALKKYGAKSGQAIMNLVTKAGKDNPASYMLDGSNQ